MLSKRRIRDRASHELDFKAFRWYTRFIHLYHNGTRRFLFSFALTNWNFVWMAHKLIRCQVLSAKIIWEFSTDDLRRRSQSLPVPTTGNGGDLSKRGLRNNISASNPAWIATIIIQVKAKEKILEAVYHLVHTYNTKSSILQPIPWSSVAHLKVFDHLQFIKTSIAACSSATRLCLLQIFLVDLWIGGLLTSILHFLQHFEAQFIVFIACLIFETLW